MRAILGALVLAAALAGCAADDMTGGPGETCAGGRCDSFLEDPACPGVDASCSGDPFGPGSCPTGWVFDRANCECACSAEVPECPGVDASCSDLGSCPTYWSFDRANCECACDAGDEERPVGTFVRPDDAPLLRKNYVDTLVLKTDGSVFRNDVTVECFESGTCQEYRDEFRGTYKVTGTAGGNRYLRFYDGNGDFTERFTYTLRGSSLTVDCWGQEVTLRHSRREEAWCGEPSDCELQDLGDIDCEAGWSCGFRDQCLSCVTADWIQAIKEFYMAHGTRSLARVARESLPSYARVRFDENAALWEGSGRQRAYRATVEGRTVYMLETVTDNQARYIDFFDARGQYLAAGDQQWGDFQWY